MAVYVLESKSLLIPQAGLSQSQSKNHLLTRGVSRRESLFGNLRLLFHFFAGLTIPHKGAELSWVFHVFLFGASPSKWKWLNHNKQAFAVGSSSGSSGSTPTRMCRHIEHVFHCSPHSPISSLCISSTWAQGGTVFCLKVVTK